MRDRGISLLRDPLRNRGIAFTEAERETFGLHGLLPDVIETAEVQVQRVRTRLDQLGSDLEKYLYLSRLQETNEGLFYRVVMSDPMRMMPFIYTPTVGDACLEFSHIFERPRGLYISLKRKGSVRTLLQNWPERDIRVIVVTSGERILGLGDLGANGMGIPIGKLALYTACARVPPAFTMPALIDVGTNNQGLLDDPLYIGLRHRRCSSGELDEFVDEFVSAVEEEFPGCCIQFEDWARADAFRLLDRYRKRICCFNDDVQGTGAAVLAGLTNALKISGGKLSEQTILFYGAGAAALGSAYLIAKALERDGATFTTARDRIWLFNRGGLVESTRQDLTNYLQSYAHQHPPSKGLIQVLESLKPNALIGFSTAHQAFDRRVVETMARINPRPSIMALSNPTSKAECTAEEAYQWSEGRAVFASGSPFPPVHYAGRTLVPSQCNNAYIFPAMGLAIFVTRARRVSDEMFLAAAEALAAEVLPAAREAGLIFPPLSAIQQTQIRIARRVAQVAFRQGLATVEEPADLSAFIEAQLYSPQG